MCLELNILNPPPVCYLHQVEHFNLSLSISEYQLNQLLCGLHHLHFTISQGWSNLITYLRREIRHQVEIIALLIFSYQLNLDRTSIINSN